MGRNRRLAGMTTAAGHALEDARPRTALRRAPAAWCRARGPRRKRSSFARPRAKIAAAKQLREPRRPPHALAPRAAHGRAPLRIGFRNAETSRWPVRTSRSRRFWRSCSQSGRLHSGNHETPRYPAGSNPHSPSAHSDTPPERPGPIPAVPPAPHYATTPSSRQTYRDCPRRCSPPRCGCLPAHH